MDRAMTFFVAMHLEHGGDNLVRQVLIGCISNWLILFV